MSRLPSTRLFIFLLVLLSGCSTAPVEYAFQSEANASPYPIVIHNSDEVQPWLRARFLPGDGSMSAGLTLLEHRTTPLEDRPQMDEISLPTQTNFEGWLTIESHKSRPFLITILIDYQQVEFTLNGQRGFLHEVPLFADRGIDLPIILDTSKLTGCHDVLVVAFADPYERNLDSEFRMSMKRVVGTRYIFQVENMPCALPKDYKPRTDVVSDIPRNVSFSPSIGLATAPTFPYSHPSKRQLYAVRAQSGKPFDFQITVAFASESDSPMPPEDRGILLFHNYQLVPSGQGGGLFAVHLAHGQESTLNAQVYIQSPPNSVDNLQAIVIVNPYRSLLQNEVSSPFLKPSFRAGLGIIP